MANSMSYIFYYNFLKKQRLYRVWLEKFNIFSILSYIGWPAVPKVKTNKQFLSPFLLSNCLCHISTTSQYRSFNVIFLSIFFYVANPNNAPKIQQLQMERLFLVLSTPPCWVHKKISSGWERLKQHPLCWQER